MDSFQNFAAAPRLVFWMHDRSEGKHWVERWARRMPPDLAICNSRFTSENLKNLFPDSTPPHAVVYCPVAPPKDLEAKRNRRSSTREEFDTSPDAVVIIQVGRLEPYKGHAHHLQALAQLRDLPGWVSWIVGGAQRSHEQAYLESLKAQARAIGIIDRVKFLGEQRDVYRCLAAADIFCQPNLRGEPFGIVFVEALYAGLPVVTSAMGGATEVVTEDCGALVPPDDVEALTSELRRLILNPSARRELSAKAPARAGALCAPKRTLDQLRRTIEGVPESVAAPAGFREALETR